MESKINESNVDIVTLLGGPKFDAAVDALCVTVHTKSMIQPSNARRRVRWRVSVEYLVLSPYIVAVSLRKYNYLRS